jgi:hypothetical protein
MLLLPHIPDTGSNYSCVITLVISLTAYCSYDVDSSTDISYLCLTVVVLCFHLLQIAV